MIHEAKLVKEAEAKNQQMWAEKSPPLQEQKVQLPTYGLRKNGHCALLKEIQKKHVKLWYNSTMSTDLVSIEPDWQPPRTAEFKAEKIQLNLLITFTLGFACLSKLVCALVVSSGMSFN